MEAIYTSDIVSILGVIAFGLTLLLPLWGDKVLKLFKTILESFSMNSKLKTIPLSKEENIIDKLKDKKMKYIDIFMKFRKN